MHKAEHKFTPDSHETFSVRSVIGEAATPASINLQLG